MSWGETPNSNKFKQSYIQGFLDISAGNLIVQRASNIQVKSNAGDGSVTALQIGSTGFDIFAGQSSTFMNYDTFAGLSTIGVSYENTVSDISNRFQFIGSSTIGGNKTLIGVSGGSNLEVFGTLSTKSYNGSLGHLFINGDASFNNNVYVTKDLSVNQSLFVTNRSVFQGDVSMSQNLSLTSATQNRSISINKGISSEFALDVSGTTLFRSKVSTVADVSINGKLSVSDDVSLNKNVTVAGTARFGAPPTSTAGYELDISGQVRIYEATGSNVTGNTSVATLTLEHGNDQGSSSIMFKSPATAINGDYAYIKYQDLSAGTSSVGLLTIGIENDATGPLADRISLYTASGSGNIGVNTQTPTFNLDVSGTMNVSGKSVFSNDISLNQNVKLGSGNNSVAINKDISSSFALDVSGITNLRAPLYTLADVSMQEKLFVNKDVSFNQNAYIGNDLSVNRFLYVQNKSLFNGDISMNQNLSLTSATRDKSVAINKDISSSFALDVSGITNLRAPLYTLADVSMQEKLFVNKDASMNQNAYIGNDLSVNRFLYVKNRSLFDGDVSMNQNLSLTSATQNRSISINKGISSEFALDVSGATLFRSKVSTVADVSINGKLSISDDVSLNKNLTVTGTARFGAPPTSTAVYELDISGQVRIYEATGSNVTSNTSVATLTLEHGNDQGSSSIMFKSPATAINGDYAYIKYQDLSAGTASVGLLTIGIENDATGPLADRISLYATGGSGYIGVNTLTPTFNLDVSGTTNISNTLTVNKIDASNAASQMDIATTQSGGALNIGTLTTRTGAINIGTGTTSKTIDVGSTSAGTTTIRGGTTLIQASSTLELGNNTGAVTVTLGRDITTGGSIGIASATTSTGGTVNIANGSSSQITTSIGRGDAIKIVNGTSTTVDISAAGALTLRGGSKIIAVSDVSMNAKLSVQGDTSLNSNVTVGGNISVSNNTIKTIGIGLQQPPASMTANVTDIEGHGTYYAYNSSEPPTDFIGSSYNAYNTGLNTPYGYNTVLGVDPSINAWSYGDTISDVVGTAYPGYRFHLDMPYQINLVSFSYSTTWFPVQGSMLGSNDGSNWNNIYSFDLSASYNNRTATAGLIASGYNSFNITTNTAFYSKYALVVKSMCSPRDPGNGTFASRFIMSNLRLVGSNNILSTQGIGSTSIGVSENLTVGGMANVFGNLTVGSTTTNTSMYTNNAAKLLILEPSGSLASATTGSLVLQHSDVSGASSIVFRSTNNSGSDYGYIQYQENVGGTSEKGLLTIGIENESGSGTSADRISLYAAAGSGFVGVNTRVPTFHLDVSGTANVSNTLTVNKIDVSNVASQMDIATTQTSGILNIGTDSARTGTIKIGNASNTNTVGNFDISGNSIRLKSGTAVFSSLNTTGDIRFAENMTSGTHQYSHNQSSGALQIASSTRNSGSIEIGNGDNNLSHTMYIGDGSSNAGALRIATGITSTGTTTIGRGNAIRIVNSNTATTVDISAAGALTLRGSTITFNGSTAFGSDMSLNRNVKLGSGNNSVAINKDISSQFALDVSGTTNISTSLTVNKIDVSNVASQMDIATTQTSGVLNIGTGDRTGAINIGTGTTGAKTIQIGSNAGGTTELRGQYINLGTSSTSQIQINPTPGASLNLGTTISGGTISLGPTTASSGSTFNIVRGDLSGGTVYAFSGNATNNSILNIATGTRDSGSTINIATNDTSSQETLNIGTGTNRTGTINIGTGATGVKTMGIGGSNTSVTMNNSTISINSSGIAYLSGTSVRIKDTGGGQFYAGRVPGDNVAADGIQVGLASGVQTTGTVKIMDGSGSTGTITIGRDGAIKIINSTVNNRFTVDISGAIKFVNNTLNNKKLILFETGGAEDQLTATSFYGFGVNPAVLRYQTSGNTDKHKFYSGTIDGLVEAGNLKLLNTTVATNSTSGALIVDGGVGIAQNLIVAKDVSLNQNLAVTGTARFGAPPASAAGYEFDINGQMRIYEATGSNVTSNTSVATLTLEHGDASGCSSIMFTSPSTTTNGDYAYIKYQDLSGATTNTGLLTIGIENDPTATATADKISLYAAGGSGYVGVNTLTPAFNLDVSGTTNISSTLTVNRIDASNALSQMNIATTVTDGVVRLGTGITSNGTLQIGTHSGLTYLAGGSLRLKDQGNGTFWVGRIPFDNVAIDSIQIALASGVQTNGSVKIMDGSGSTGTITIGRTEAIKIVNSNTGTTVDISAAGALTLRGSTITFNGSTAFGSDMSLNQNVKLGSGTNSVAINKDISSSFALDVSGITNLRAPLYTLADVSMQEKLFVNKDVSFNQNAYIGNDLSVNRFLYVKNRSLFDGDVSMNQNLSLTSATQNRSISINKGVSSEFALDVSGATLFRSKVSTVADVSINGKVSISDDVSLNKNLTVTGTARFGAPPASTAGYEFDINGQMRIYEATGSNVTSNTSVATLTLEHGDASGCSSIMFKSPSTSSNSDYAYIKYQDLSGSTTSASLLTIGIENNPTGTSLDRISLYAAGGSGYVGVNTLTPQQSLDVSGQMRIYEGTGTAASDTSGTLILEHANAGGTSSLVFKGANSVTKDYAYVQYRDNTADSVSSIYKWDLSSNVPTTWSNTATFTSTGTASNTLKIQPSDSSLNWLLTPGTKPSGFNPTYCISFNQTNVFDASATRINYLETDVSYSSNFSLSLWFYPTFVSLTNRYITIASLSQSVAGYSAEIAIDGNSQCLSFLANNNGTAIMQTAPSIVTINTWHHLVFTYNSITRQSKLYLNNSLRVSTTSTAINTYNWLTIGMRFGQTTGSVSKGFQGGLCYVNLFNNELSTSDVSQMYLKSAYTPSSTEERGLMTIGIENENGYVNNDRIALWPGAGQGLVGINTQNPQATLDVSGNANVSSILNVSNTLTVNKIEPTVINGQMDIATTQTGVLNIGTGVRSGGTGAVNINTNGGSSAATNIGGGTISIQGSGNLTFNTSFSTGPINIVTGNRTAGGSFSIGTGTTTNSPTDAFTGSRTTSTLSLGSGDTSGSTTNVFSGAYTASTTHAFSGTMNNTTTNFLSGNATNNSVLNIATGTRDSGSEINIANNNTSETLNIGTGQSRTGPINIGTGSTTSKVVSIGGGANSGTTTITGWNLNLVGGSGTGTINTGIGMTSGSINIGAIDTTATSTAINIGTGSASTGIITIGRREAIKITNSNTATTVDISAAGALTLRGSTITFNGPSAFSNDMSLNQNVKLGSGTKSVAINKDISSQFALDVSGITNLRAPLYTLGDVSMQEKLFVNKDVSMNQNAYIGNDLSVNRFLYVRNRSVFDGDISLSQNLSLTSALRNRSVAINKDISSQYALDVSGNSLFRGTVNTTGTIAITNGGSINVTGGGSILIDGAQVVGGSAGTTLTTSGVKIGNDTNYYVSVNKPNFYNDPSLTIYYSFDTSINNGTQVQNLAKPGTYDGSLNANGGSSTGMIDTSTKKYGTASLKNSNASNNNGMKIIGSTIPVSRTMSFSIWVNYTSAPTTGNKYRILEFTNSISTNQTIESDTIALEISGNGIVYPVLTNGTTTCFATLSAPIVPYTLTNTGWNHIVWTITPTTSYIYVNAAITQIDTITTQVQNVTSRLTVNLAFPFYTPSAQNYEYIGNIDEFRWYTDKVLNEAEIYQLNTNNFYTLDISGGFLANGASVIYEPSGSKVSYNSGTLTLLHGDPSGSSSILFKSVNDPLEYGYIQYEENSAGSTGYHYGLMTIGIENDAGAGAYTTQADRVSLFPSGGRGFVGVNTKTPQYSLDVSGTLNINADASINDVQIGKGPGNVATNTVLGFQALKSNTIGSENIAVGYQALINSNGNSNVGVGPYALSRCTSGVNNTGVGFRALDRVVTAYHNVGIGRYAGSGDGNPLFQGDSNTFLGSFTYLTDNWNNSTAVGVNAKITASYQIKLGRNVDTVYCGDHFILQGDGTNCFIRNTLGNSLYLGNGSTNIAQITNSGLSVTGQTVSTVAASGTALVLKNTVSGTTDSQTNIDFYSNTNGAFLTGRITSKLITGTTWSSSMSILPTFDGTATAGMVITAKSSTVSDLKVTGNVEANNYNAISDYRFKENVVPLNGCFTVDVLNPVIYNLKNSDRQDIGFIAHEVQEFYPFLVNGEKDGKDTQSLNYNGFIGILTMEIKDLKKKVSEQEARALAQEARIQALEKMVFDK